MKKTIFYKTDENNVLLVYTYSTEGKQLRQKETGEIYDDAVDVGIEVNGEYEPKYYNYEEVDN